MTSRPAHLALRIALVAFVLIFLIVCGAHLGGISHDAGPHSIATAVVVVFAFALVLLAASIRHHPQPDQASGGPGTPNVSRAPTGAIPGILRPLRC